MRVHLYPLIALLGLQVPLWAAWLDCFESAGDGELAAVINTGDWMGWLEVSADPWVYSYSLDRYLYMPHENCDSPGEWAWLAPVSDPLLEDLFLHLPFDNNEARDTSGHLRPLSRSGAVPGEGAFAGSFFFDGVDDHLRVLDFPYGPQFTVSFWFNSPDNAGTLYQYMFSHGPVHKLNSGSYYFLEDNHGTAPGVIKTNLRDANDEPMDEFLTEAGYSDGQWHLYTVTVGDNRTTVYIDGEPLMSTEQGGDAFDPDGAIIIGGRSDRMEERFYEGYLDDIRVYNRALPAGQVKALFEGGR